MELIAIVLGGLALLFLLVCVYLLRERSRLTEHNYRLAGERDVAQARIGDEARARESFQAMAGEALRNSNEEFLRLAKKTLDEEKGAVSADLDKRKAAVDALVKPINEALERTHKELRQVGKDNAGLRQHVLEMSESNRVLRSETGKLTQALRKPNVRGRYGEIQLERVVELAGMRAYCDFSTQEHLRDDQGNLQKPDLVVRLPNERIIAVDAKTSIDGYMDALDADTPDEAEVLMDRYAQNVLDQMQKLAKKQYWAQFDASPEIVVMFVPGDQLVDAALERQPKLLDLAAEQNIVLASPSTLIGLLRAVHVGWREKNLTDSAEELFDLGRRLHERAAIVIEHAAKVGGSLDKARDSYNSMVNSISSRLVPTLRKFEERGARSKKDLKPMGTVEGEVRELQPLAPPETVEGATPAERLGAAGEPDQAGG